MKIIEVSKESYAAAKEAGWPDFACCHGYGVFDGEYPTDFGEISGVHIEKIDVMDTWCSDETAANHAERYNGIKIIRDMRGLPEVFVDTQENRARIIKQVFLNHAKKV